MATTTTNLLALAKVALSDEDAAVALMTSLRWPNGVACPRCGGADPWKITPKAAKGRRTARKGLYQCRACKRQFSVTTGSVFESSHLPLSKWLMAIHLMSASKKGMSAHQLHRMIGCTYRAAWFMMHRLRYAMTQNTGLFSGTVEVDETYVGGKRRVGRYSYEGKGGRPGPKDQTKAPVVALVERGGRALAFPVERVDGATLQAAVRERTIPAESDMMTDQWQGYMGFANGFKSHSHIPHDRKIYVRGNVHTNTVEGFFAILKRGIMGTFHHVSRGHLHRYCDEFAFRYSYRSALGVTDGERAAMIVLGAEGKRLTYKQPAGNRAA